ncbi:MAG TPA: hypothetical protein ENI51_03895 [Candidatus Atribacteria bacterium]|nr:hypothetical protein [Candidatus Atribacteria bacterium]
MKTKILVLDNEDEEKKIDFEIDFFLSLTTKERFSLLFKKMKEIKSLMKKNGTGKISQIIKRK